MKEKNKLCFFNTSVLNETPNIQAHCNASYLQAQLRERLPGEDITVAGVSINRSGRYTKKVHPVIRLLGGGKAIKGLPPFCEVVVTHKTGGFTESITVWSPLAWNGRFAGTAGGGSITGGKSHIIAPDNTSRGLSLPIAVLNGFTAATTDGGNPEGKQDWALDAATGELKHALIENWRVASTHFMTLCGKAVAEILHGRVVEYAYLHGGSGGGRQSMMEVQEHPQDYDGVWASCPAINWTKFVLCGLWPLAVMNSHGHSLKPHKIKFFAQAARDSVGGRDAYYKLESRVDFDPFSVVGQSTKDGPITPQDAEIMREIWGGPRRPNGEQLWYGFWPGVIFWNVGLPIGSFYYTLLGKKPKAFMVTTQYARWVTRNSKQDFSGITIESFEKLFDESTTQFANATGDNANLRPFMEAGGKLLIDHGLDDPLIPVDGTLDYYRHMTELLGDKTVDSFCRLYLTPGDGHGNCYGNGPGITETDGMRALIAWVEKGRAPGALRVVQVDKKTGDILCERTQAPYHERGEQG